MSTLLLCVSSTIVYGMGCFCYYGADSAVIDGGCGDAGVVFLGRASAVFCWIGKMGVGCGVGCLVIFSVGLTVVGLCVIFIFGMLTLFLYSTYSLYYSIF